LASGWVVPSAVASVLPGRIVTEWVGTAPSTRLAVAAQRRQLARAQLGRRHPDQRLHTTSIDVDGGFVYLHVCKHCHEAGGFYGQLVQVMETGGDDVCSRPALRAELV
jgi:hypothetical protein